MKRLLLPLLIALATAVVVAAVVLWLLRIPAFRSSAVGRVSEQVLSAIQYTVAPGSFRRKIYPGDSTATPYPGAGEVRVNKPERLLVISQAEGGEIKEVPVEELNSYLSKGYLVEKLDANDSYLLYTVGRFQRLEELEPIEENDGENVGEGTDRLLVLGDPFDAAKVYTYHVVRDGSAALDESGADTVLTRVGVEKLAGASGANMVEDLGTASELSSEALNRLFQVGDTVIVTPVPFFPGLAVSDENGIPYASVVTVRRVRVPKL